MASAEAVNFFIGLFVIIIVFSSFFYLVRESLLRSKFDSIREKEYEQGWNDAVKHIVDARNIASTAKNEDKTNE